MIELEQFYERKKHVRQLYQAAKKEKRMFHAEDMMMLDFDRLLETLTKANFTMKDAKDALDLKNEMIETQKIIIERLTCLNQKYLELFKHYVPELHKELTKNVESNSNSDH